MDLSLNKLNDEFIKRLICVGIDFAIFILILGYLDLSKISVFLVLRLINFCYFLKN